MKVTDWNGKPVGDMPAGIYSGISNAAYHADKTSIGQSTIGAVLLSPFHYKWAIDNPSPPTSAMLIGSAFHTMTLEPELFSEEFKVMGAGEKISDELVGAYSTGQFVVYPGESRRGNAWKAFKESNKDVHIFLQSELDAVERHCESLRGKEVLTKEQYSSAQAIAKAALENRIAKHIIQHPKTSVELSVYWKDETGKGLKCRPDVLTPAGVVNEAYALAGMSNPYPDAGEDDWVIMDLKSTRSSIGSDFYTSVRRFGYDRQAAHYLTGCRENNINVIGFGFIVAGKDEPSICTVYARLSDDDIERGLQQMRRALDEISACEFADEWPKPPEGYQFLGREGAYDEVAEGF